MEVRIIEVFPQYAFRFLFLHLSYIWVYGVMVLDVGYEFRDRGSIPSECQIPT